MCNARLAQAGWLFMHSPLVKVAGVMLNKTVIVMLAAIVLLPGCRSHHAPRSALAIGQVKHHTRAVHAGDPFFNPRNHNPRLRHLRGYGQVRPVEWREHSRNGFAVAPIYADHGNYYPLDSGDVVRIDVFEQDNLSRLYRIDGSGHIAMPLIGQVKARGLTPRQLGKVITRRLARDYVKDPQVTVEISRHRPFYILGEVRKAGKYDYVPGMTVETAVAIAGGYSPRANESKIMVIRRIGPRLVRAYVPNNYQIRPGDTLKVVERFF